MVSSPATVALYHITPISNLNGIASSGALLSDARLANQPHEVIGYTHIKQRRLTEYRISCCGNRFVGEFVPFYYCPRSPMLYTINKGNTGRPAGSQGEIVHLVTSVGRVATSGVVWAISDGNAGAGHTTFSNDMKTLSELDWSTIRSDTWTGKAHQKSAEFLVADSVPWSSVVEIGCLNDAASQRVKNALNGCSHIPTVVVRPAWYY